MTPKKFNMSHCCKLAVDGPMGKVWHVLHSQPAQDVCTSTLHSCSSNEMQTHLLVMPAFMWLSIPVFTGDIAANGKVVEVESTADTVEVAAGREVTAVGRVVVMEVGCNGGGGVMCSSFMASR